MSAPKTTQDPPATTVLAEELAEIAWGRGGDPHRRASRQANSNGPPIEFDTPEVLQDAADRDLCGLALSGGGIRSATFNLGVIQALAELGQLSKIDYLSTVSGGGYIGSWLTAWIHRGGGVEAVEKKLATAVPAPQRESAAPPPRYEEQAEIGFLREHSNYLTPRVGVLGADTWSAISTYLRNLVLNLTILIVALLPLVLVPRVMFDFVRWLSGAALADVVVAPWHRLAEATTWLSTTAAPSWLGTIAQMVSAASTSITDFLMATMPESAQGLPGAQTLAFVALLAAAAMTGMNLRYLRKGIVVINGERGDEHRSRKERLERWFPRQSAVLLTIVAPAAAGAAFIAASMLYSRAMTGRDFAFLVGGYLVLFIALVLVWRPERQRVAGGLFAKLWAAWFVVLALLYAAPAAVLAAAMGYWLSGSTLTSLSATWMVVGVPVVVAIFSASVVLHLGLMGRMVSEEVREWWSRLGGWLLIVALGWSAACLLSLFGPLLVHRAGAALRVPAAGAWLLTTAFGVIAGRSPATNGSERRLVRLAVGIAPYVFIVGLFLALAALTDWALVRWFAPDGDSYPWLDAGYYWGRLTAVPWWWTGVSTAACAAAAWLLARRVDVNAFSLQPFYRNRLVRCYLGASNIPRRPHPFTGFDREDDLTLADLARGTHPVRPYPIVNVALNLVKGEKLAWQERKAASFTLAPLHCGFGDSYRRTRDYAGGGLTLGQAFATSGAAASPNMGYHSSPALAFLMTVFNVRLGIWLGNPKRQNRARWREPGPRSGLIALLSELFGNTSESSAYVYLSDGGHFDNLGIYELLRRRCRYIIACDAGADPEVRFDDLGAVIRKCRTDFGVDVKLDTASLQRDAETGRSLYYCAVGKILYREGTEGTLLYLKASLTGSESVDVLNYAAGDSLFPHQSTADQWFSESQFESYRQLGYLCGMTVFEAAARDEKRAKLEGMFTSLRERWYPSTATAEGTFTRHTAALDKLHARLDANKQLAFLDAQIFPSWQELMSGAVKVRPVELWLPRDADARRDGFYFCTALIQLMENVYTDLNLGTQFDHPDHRGWMNLFKHWSWCGMLRVTWAVAAATYGARFQTFCRERLGLEIGETVVEPAVMAKLNAVEQRYARWHMVQKDHRERVLYAITLRVQDPMSLDDAARIDFTVGFAILEDVKDRAANEPRATRETKLAYLRVQDHLRKMGLARDALRSMIIPRRVVDVRELDDDADPADLTGGKVLKRMYDSVLAELADEVRDAKLRAGQARRGVAL